MGGRRLRSKGFKHGKRRNHNHQHRYKEKTGFDRSNHHMTPRSRKESPNDEFNESEFNLFPWDRTAHRAWHSLFVNMTLEEVCARWEEIYSAIFEHSNSHVSMFWLEDCRLEKNHKRHLRRKRFSVTRVQVWWVQCFGNNRKDRARVHLDYMLLCRVLGKHTLLNLNQFLGAGPSYDFLAGVQKRWERREALYTLFFYENPADISLAALSMRIQKIVARYKWNP